MPLIPAAADYSRWLSEEPDPRDLLQPFPAEPMRMWPISTRVNKRENDDPSIAEPVRIERACGIVAVVDRPFLRTRIMLKRTECRMLRSRIIFLCVLLGNGLTGGVCYSHGACFNAEGAVGRGNVRQSARSGNER
jgi:hypothetical protein